MARKIPFEQPEVLNAVRIGYITVQLVVLAVYYYTSQKVRNPFVRMPRCRSLRFR